MTLATCNPIILNRVETSFRHDKLSVVLDRVAFSSSYDAMAVISIASITDIALRMESHVHLSSRVVGHQCLSYRGKLRFANTTRERARSRSSFFAGSWSSMFVLQGEIEVRQYHKRESEIKGKLESTCPHFLS